MMPMIKNKVKQKVIGFVLMIIKPFIVPIIIIVILLSIACSITDILYIGFNNEDKVDIIILNIKKMKQRIFLKVFGNL